VVVDGEKVEDDIGDTGIVSAEERLGVPCAVLELEPDQRGLLRGLQRLGNARTPLIVAQKVRKERRVTPKASSSSYSVSPAVKTAGMGMSFSLTARVNRHASMPRTYGEVRHAR
jgi:hypothetical protein